MNRPPGGWVGPDKRKRTLRYRNPGRQHRQERRRTGICCTKLRVTEVPRGLRVSRRWGAPDAPQKCVPHSYLVASLSDTTQQHLQMRQENVIPAAPWWGPERPDLAGAPRKAIRFIGAGTVPAAGDVGEARRPRSFEGV